MSNIEAKLHRGPMHGERMTVKEFQEIIEVLKPPSLVDTISNKEFNDVAPMNFFRGSYRRSNKN